MVTLRPYQERTLIRLREEISLGSRRLLVVAPTGAGKTTIAGKIISGACSNGKKSIFLAHRTELIEQCSDRLSEMGVPHGVIQSGSKRQNPDADVQVASIQTLINRDHFDADIIIVDEAHRSTSSTYIKILQRYNNPVVLGLSVGPNSFCEFRGGPFGSGWCGPISKAFSIINKSLPGSREKLQTFDTVRTDGMGIESRGWNGQSFCWKPVRSFLRHKCDRDVRTIHAGGDKLTVTNDHSVYRLASCERIYIGTRYKDISFLEHVPSDQLELGDILPRDNGRTWDGYHEELFDALSLDIPLMVRVQFSDLLDREDLAASPQEFYSWKNAPHGEMLPPHLYLENENVLPAPKYISTFGGNSRSCPRYIKLSDWAYILGFYLGDGWTDGTRTNFAVETKLCEKISKELRSLPGIRLDPIPRKMHGASYEIRCSNSLFSNIIRSAAGDKKAFEKYIPGEWIVSWPASARRRLLQGMIDSDGHLSEIKGKERIYYATTSQALARGLMSLLRSLNIAGSIHISKPKPGGIVRGRRIIGKRNKYTVHWSVASANGVNTGYKGVRSKYYHRDHDLYEAPVRKITIPKSRPKYVYDLEMDGHPSFVANGILVHNTATPYRMDGKGLGSVDLPGQDHLEPKDREKFELYNSLVEVAGVQELIDLGYLVMPTVYWAPEIDKSNIRVTAGEYNKKDSAGAMEGPVLRGDLLKNWARKCSAATGVSATFDAEDRLVHTDCNACTIVFAPSIRQSHIIVEQFKAIGVSAAHVDGKTPANKRAQILRDLRDRKLTVCSNFGILTEGYDLPHLEAIIGGRLSRSRNLVKQMIGRLMRPDDDKRFAFLFDHADWTRTHGLVNEQEVYSLQGRESRPRKGASAAPVRECPDCEALCHISTPICADCGYEFPRRELQYTDEELVELNPSNINNGRQHDVPIQERQEDFNRWCLRCSEEGYKPNWARMQYQRIYSEWPSKQTGIATPRFFWLYQKRYEKAAKKSEGATA